MSVSVECGVTDSRPTTHTGATTTMVQAPTLSGVAAAAVVVVVMGLMLLVAPVAAERGTRAVQGYGLMERYVCVGV